MEDIWKSLRDMPWEPIPEEDIIARCGRNYPWWNNGLDEIQCKNQPDGYVKGRLPGQTRTAWKTKRCWWNNGVEQTLMEECPPGWQKGRLWSKEHKASFKAKVGCSGKYDRTRFKKINNTSRIEE